jgi:thiol-disulfide isomerase/thioredoxin
MESLMRPPRLVVLVALALGAWGFVSAGALLTGEEAPDWRVSEWINGDPGSLQHHRGRVVVLHFFQMWCPGSNEFSLPVMQRWDELYGDRDDFMIVSMHSVFEGHDYQTPERLKKLLRRNGIWHPVGIDAYAHKGDLVPFTMQQYQAVGTPQVAVIDKDGILVFNHFGEFHIPTVEFLLDRLLKVESEAKPRPKPKVGRNDKLSGTYKLQLEQTTNTCGEMTAPVTMNVNIDVITDFVDARFPRELLGRSDLTLHFNTRTLKIDSNEDVAGEVEGVPTTTNITVMGRFVEGSNPPQITYNAMLRRQSEREDLVCLIRARGTATRIGD